MGFGVVFQAASYDNILLSYNTPQVENASLNMLLSTGASCVRIDIGYDAWLKNNSAAQTELSSLVNQIRSAGKCLIIADAAAESYRKGGQLPWSQFVTAWLQRVQILASTFHPDYYIVIKEPGWYAPMISDISTNPLVQNASEWVNLTESLASTVKSVSPNTKIGIAISADSLSTNPSLYVPFLRGVEQNAAISFIGFDIYTVTGFQNTQSFLTQYGAGGKAIWIAECWSGDGTQIFDSSRSNLDSSWILLVYYFGQMINASMIVPFYTNLFASYSLTGSSPTQASQIISLYQQRTPVFYEFQSIIACANSSSDSACSGNVSSSTSSVSTSPSTSSSESSSSSFTTSETSTSGPRGRQTLLEAIGLVAVIVLVAGLATFYRARSRTRGRS